MLVLPPVLFTRLAGDSGPFHLLRGPDRSVSESANFRFAGNRETIQKRGSRKLAGLVPGSRLVGSDPRQRRADYGDVSGARAGDSEFARSWRRDLVYELPGRNTREAGH
jgi:hypothetical protein